MTGPDFDEHWTEAIMDACKESVDGWQQCPCCGVRSTGGDAHKLSCPIYKRKQRSTACAQCGGDPLTHIHYREGGFNGALQTIPRSAPPAPVTAADVGDMPITEYSNWRRGMWPPTPPEPKPVPERGLFTTSKSNKEIYWELRHRYERTGDKRELEKALEVVPREMPDDWAVDPRDAGKVSEIPPWPFTSWLGFWEAMSSILLSVILTSVLIGVCV